MVSYYESIKELIHSLGESPDLIVSKNTFIGTLRSVPH
jgi:hypothetical protein